MALQQNATSTTGLEIENAYFKIDEYSCDKNNMVKARIRAYVSKKLADSGAAPIEGIDDSLSFVANYEDNAENTKKQIYEHAKTLDKYADAIDV